MIFIVWHDSVRFNGSKVVLTGLSQTCSHPLEERWPGGVLRNGRRRFFVTEQYSCDTATTVRNGVDGRSSYHAVTAHVVVLAQ